MRPASHPLVEVEGFTGPLDLLARLIERRELDVLTISLAAVTEQYLDHLARLQLRDPEHLSAFLVVAAKLLLIKSSLLLPKSPRRATNGDVAPDPTDLTVRLQEYQKYRQAGRWLAARDAAGSRSYVRPPVTYRPAVAIRPDPIDPALLQAAMIRALRRPKAEPDPTPVAVEPRLSVADALGLLQGALDRFATVRFADLLTDRADRGRYVALFLAILEAIRQGQIAVTQDGRFGEIEITRNEAAGRRSDSAPR
ncbi:MAG: segregation and condensation protein A [Chloroflexota bacterium]